jgi:hypothetical protein
MNPYEAVKYLRSLDIGSLPYKGLTGIYYDDKTVNGINTGEKCIKFYFETKKSLSELAAHEIVPETITYNNTVFKTDVEEAPISEKLVTDCHSLNSAVEPVKSNYIKRRPLLGGCSSINIGSSDATLGIMVVDKKDGQVVALSNSHVYAASQLHGYYAGGNEITGNNVLGLSARQPGTNAYNPYGSVTRAVDYIGNCKRAVVVGNKDYTTDGDGWIRDTTVDAAIVGVDKNLISSVSVSAIGLNAPGPFKFASDDEITSLLDPVSPNYRAPVFRSGRTCGPIGRPGNNFSCALSVQSFGTEAVGSYTGYISYFSESFVIEGNVIATRGGDSGSAIYALLSANVPALSTWKCIGLVFAGPQFNPSYGIGSRISAVSQDLDVVAWNGVVPTLSARTDVIVLSAGEYLPYSTSAVITLSGRRYHQLGRT